MIHIRKVIPTIFEDREIRRLYDEKTETWFFSVVDIVQILTQQPDYKATRIDATTDRVSLDRILRWYAKPNPPVLPACHSMNSTVISHKTFIL